MRGVLAGIVVVVRQALPNQWIWDLVDELIYQFQARSVQRS